MSYKLGRAKRKGKTSKDTKRREKMPTVATFAINWDEAGLVAVLDSPFPPTFNDPGNFDFQVAGKPDETENGIAHALPAVVWNSVLVLKQWILELINCLPNLVVTNNAVLMDVVGNPDGNLAARNLARYNTVAHLTCRWAELKNVAPFVREVFANMSVYYGETDWVTYLN